MANWTPIHTTRNRWASLKRVNSELWLPLANSVRTSTSGSVTDKVDLWQEVEGSDNATPAPLTAVLRYRNVNDTGTANGITLRLTQLPNGIWCPGSCCMKLPLAQRLKPGTTFFFSWINQVVNNVHSTEVIYSMFSSFNAIASQINCSWFQLKNNETFLRQVVCTGTGNAYTTRQLEAPWSAAAEDTAAGVPIANSRVIGICISDDGNGIILVGRKGIYTHACDAVTSYITKDVYTASTGTWSKVDMVEVGNTTNKMYPVKDPISNGVSPSIGGRNADSVGPVCFLQCAVWYNTSAWNGVQGNSELWRIYQQIAAMTPGADNNL